MIWTIIGIVILLFVLWFVIYFMLTLWPKIKQNRASSLVETIAEPKYQAGSKKDAEYGQKTIYDDVRSLDFPDISIIFLGKTRVGAGGVYNRGFIHYNFKVALSPRSNIRVLYPTGRGKEIFWTPGTGEIGPQIFGYFGKAYMLEMGFRDNCTGNDCSLKENEYIITQLPPGHPYITDQLIDREELDRNIYKKR